MQTETIKNKINTLKRWCFHIITISIQNLNKVKYYLNRYTNYIVYKWKKLNKKKK